MAGDARHNAKRPDSSLEHGANIMGQLLALLLLVLLALASAAGYLFVTEKIAAGERQIADGQRQLEEGQPAFDEGKARLKDGKRELAAGKTEYGQTRSNLFLVLADDVLQGGKDFKGARERIAEGDKQVAKGEAEIDAGGRRIDAGKLELSRGREQLRVAEVARVACALGATIFASASILLGIRWRRSLVRVFTRADA